MLDIKKVQMYTDGACSGNPGPGGYGTILRYGEFEKKLSGGEAQTTNNRMELMGVITAMEALTRPCIVHVHTDSAYVVNAFNKGWIDNWKKKGWKTSGKEPVKNKDLWTRLLSALEPHKVDFIWVKGHAGDEMNERCDELATTAADGDDLLIDPACDVKT